MIKSKYKVIGVMSGTSLDGVDLAHVIFEFDEIWSFKIVNTSTVPYSKSWFDKLSNLIYLDRVALELIDSKYTTYLSEVISDFIKKNELSDIDAICSHGHTALHQPDKGITIQIGNKKDIARDVRQNVVCDFRLQDVAYGGQGAPLVPIGDRLLFPDFEYCLNLGGFANVSFEENNKRIAFDICPVNIVLNYYARKLGLDYDNNGNMATQGEINEDLLRRLNRLDYYLQRHPKSLGIEWVRTAIIPIIDEYQLAIKDVLRTLIEHMAVQIALVIEEKSDAKVLISGGGVYNSFLINRLKSLTKNPIIIPSKDIIEYKEALIFGLLGVLKLRNEINCLASVTGASHDHSSGIIHYF